MIPSVFTEKCDVKIQFFRIIGLVGIFSKNETKYRPLPKISLLVLANLVGVYYVMRYALMTQYKFTKGLFTWRWGTPGR